MSWYGWLAVALVVVAFVLIKQAQARLSTDQVEAVRQALQRGAKIVDVRTPGEFSGGHVPGAVNLPLGELERNLKKLGKKNKPIVLYCRSGSRSARAAALLRQRGFSQVLDMKTQGNYRRITAETPQASAAR